MKFLYWMLVFSILLTSCAPARTVETTPAPLSTPGLLPTAILKKTSAPETQGTAGAFLEAWKAEEYSKMYSMLTQVSREALSMEDFEARYRDAARNLSLISLDYKILSSLTNPQSAQVAYQVDFKTSLLGTLQRDMLMNLALEGGQWYIQWDAAMILPELKDGNRLALDIKIPARGNIYDREGNALAAQSDVMALGVIPNQIEEGNENAVYNELSTITGKSSLSIMGQVEEALPGDYVVIGEVPAQDFAERFNQVSSMTGIYYNPYSARLYYGDGISPHVIGYVQAIDAGEAEEYQRRGYRIDERVGKAGLEKWGEPYLTGKRGAALYVVNPQGEIVTRLAQNDTQPASAIYTTLDRDLQAQAQRAIAGFRGAIVVIERDTGRVLAMVSSPSYDPNAFEPNNYNSSTLVNNIFSSPSRPLLNRAAQGGYPLGSVFKIITAAAALESGIYTPQDEYNCQHTFTELQGYTLEDWTLEKEVAPSGVLTLPEGLMRSCNPWFYHIGLDLYMNNKGNLIPEMARAFGLGSATGIGQVAEDVGAIPNSSNEYDSVQLAIGQGAMLVTPLQVANFIAAVGNGGTLYRPQVVEKIVSPNGDIAMEFKPEERSSLPVSPENLKVIQDAMRSVVSNPRGTAFRTFTGMSVPVFGKTGTATTSDGDPHAWFAGYTNARRTDKPDIAIAVIAENSGDGSRVAAPIFRRVVELYFEGRPGRLYDWESSYYVTRTPAPDETETPEPPTE